MLELAALLLALGAVATAVRWQLRHSSALATGRSLPAFPAVGVDVLIALAFVALLPGIHRRAEEHRLAAVADVLVGAHVTVHCQSFGESFVDAGNELGYVKFSADGVPEHHTLIKREQCGLLRHYLSSHGRNPSLDEVVAVHVLTHESMHMRGETQESVAECEAVQRDATTAEQLGASEADADRLAVTYWQQVYPHMPSGYVTGDCTAGGPLDEHLPTAPWTLSGH